SLEASDHNLWIAIAGSAAATDDIGAGVSFGQTRLDNRTVTASIGSNAQVTADAVKADAHATDEMYVIVVAGAKVTGTLAIAGSIANQGMTGAVDATDAQGATFTASRAYGVVGTPNHDRTLWGNAGAMALNVRKQTQQGQQQISQGNQPSAKISAGASAALTDTGTDVRSRATGATISAAGGPISFSATSTPTIVVISVAGAITSGGGDAQSGSSGAPIDLARARAGT